VEGVHDVRYGRGVDGRGECSLVRVSVQDSGDDRPDATHTTRPKIAGRTAWYILFHSFQFKGLISSVSQSNSFVGIFAASSSGLMVGFWSSDA
jgi:hypothetical protein